MRARDFLGPDGPLVQALGRYEHREGQLQMAAAVEGALAQDGLLMCEAGTGTGKTLAYLVPALASGLRVVVSTASKTLQEQIMRKDLPLLERCGLEAQTLLMKGLGNYICLRRLEEARLAAVEHPGGQRALRVVHEFSDCSDNGDMVNMVGLAENHPVRRQVNSSSDTRVGARCPFFQNCFVTQNRRSAEDAQLLVVNHHLFFADLAVRGADHPGAALPPYDAVIFDEAHKLEEIAAGFFGARISTSRLTRLLRDTERSTRRSRGDSLVPLCQRASKYVHQLFERLNMLGDARSNRTALTEQHLGAPIMAAYHALDNALVALEGELRTQEHDATLHTATKRVRRVRKDLATVMEPRGDSVVWLERDEGLAVVSAPVEIGSILRDKLYDKGIAVVLTSASLTVGGDFSFLRQRLGLDLPATAPCEQLQVAAALDHRNQALLYTPTDLPHVNDGDFVAQAVPRIVSMATATPGGTFVLCTSTARMRAFAAGLRKRLKVLVLLQGEAPKAALLEAFVDDGDAVLVATMSFWEGVDVPGTALQLVVIDRIPFPVPSDPLVRARSERLEARGQSAFRDYMLPRAAMTLKQGFGRLLRTRSDRGVVAVLDRRVAKSGYGSVLIDSLPDVRRTRQLEDVLSFWQ